MNKSIGGPLGAQQLATLLGHRDDRGMEHAPPHVVALADARDHLRRACAAIGSAEHPDARRAAELVRLHSRLRDELLALETLKRPL